MAKSWNVEYEFVVDEGFCSEFSLALICATVDLLFVLLWKAAACAAACAAATAANS